MSTISEADLKILRLAHSQKNNVKAVVIFLACLSVYLAVFFAILYVGWPWGLPLTIVCGWAIAMLFVVGHDACHQSFTSSARLNKLIGRISFLPSLHNFALWDLGHNRTHHRYNNVRGFDYVWEPMTPQDYLNASFRKRVLYLFWRSPVGIPLNYMFDLWPSKMFLIRGEVVGAEARKYWLDGVLVYGFAIVQTAVAVVIGPIFGNSAFESWLLAVLLPFIIWNIMMSVVIYLHHTHPSVPWYSSVDEWREANGKLTGTVHVRFPWLLGKLMLEIMEHNAHHYAPGVPLYNLKHMQTEIEDERIVEWDWSLKEFLRVTSQCKLYDYDNKRWVTFPQKS
jgi:acyl-lipid omega-6 desaturase (Delta-12 desaturase)